MSFVAIVVSSVALDDALFKTLDSVKCINNAGVVLVTPYDPVVVESLCVVDVALQDENKGVYGAMNVGLKYVYSAGRYSHVWFLNAGDYLQNIGHLGRLNNSVYVMDYISSLDAKKKIISRAELISRQYRMGSKHQCYVYPVVLIGFYYDTEYLVSADFDFNVRFLMAMPDVAVKKLSGCIYYDENGFSSKHYMRTVFEQALAVGPLGLRHLFCSLGLIPFKLFVGLVKRYFPALYVFFYG